MNVLDIYYRMPIFIQNLLVSYQGYILHRQRFGKEYHRYLEELKKEDFNDKQYQTEKLNRRFVEFVRFAVENSPFYRSFYKDVKISSIKSVKDIGLLPILEKETLRQNISQVYTISAKEGLIENTSGTTGKSLIVRYTRKDQQRRLAYLDFFKWQHGYTHLKMRQATFNSAKVVSPKQKSKIFWRDNLWTKQRFYSGFHCQKENAKYFIENLNCFKPQTIDGYPSAIYTLAKQIVYGGQKITFKPIAIFPTAEVLLPENKTLIEKAFGCPVRDQYASTEGAPFITECTAGRLHICQETGIIETDSNGDMLVTSFDTHGTPLIRYRIGDRLEFDSNTEACPCGCCFPTVKRIIGRSQDYLQSLSKGRFTEVYFSLDREAFHNSVKEMQFVQNKADTIDVNVAVAENYTKEMDELVINELHYIFGDDMNINIHKMDRIPREKSGKFRMVINNLPKEENK